MASKGGVLGNLEILAEIERGKIIVFPFNKERVQTTSIDVTLGSHYYRELGADGGRGHIRPEPVYQISTNNGNCAIYQGQDIWGSYHNALPFIDAVKELHTKTLNTPPLFLTFPTETFNPCDRQRFIILNPGENILAHTEEFIGSSSSDITTMCETKSTFGRMLGETCKCAGLMLISLLIPQDGETWVTLVVGPWKLPTTQFMHFSCAWGSPLHRLFFCAWRDVIQVQPTHKRADINREIVWRSCKRAGIQT